MRDDLTMKNLILPLALLASPVAADEMEDAFVEANLLGIFYHELGHAIIDVMQLPVFGQEEDAADVASVFLIDSLWDDAAAIDLAYDASFGFAAEAMETGDDVAYWDVHGPDEQRFFNTVCLFYGANPDTRDGFAEDFELPEYRADSCEEEFALAADSWGPVLDDLAELSGHSLSFEAKSGMTRTADIIKAEVLALNKQFSWPTKLTVETAECGEANAYYDPSITGIVVCEEFAAHLSMLYQKHAE